MRYNTQKTESIIALSLFHIATLSNLMLMLLKLTLPSSLTKADFIGFKADFARTKAVLVDARSEIFRRSSEFCETSREYKKKKTTWQKLQKNNMNSL